ncbi:CHAT domain-containing protein [Ruegeria denitrificans]|uniref:CHAT domain-containing protein n=1 Tax=Ruegeria denitrificans TaxID=1715692 RepID=UPI003C7E0091
MFVEKENVTSCPVCGYDNEIIDGAAIGTDSALHVISPLPEGELIEKIRHTNLLSGGRKLICSAEKRQFRREFITREMVPRLEVFKDIFLALQDDSINVFQAVLSHYHDIDDEFFASLIIVASGAVEIKSSVADDIENAPVFQPASENDERLSKEEFARRLDYLRGLLGRLAYAYSVSSLLNGVQESGDINWGVSRVLDALPVGFLRYPETSEHLLQAYRELVSQVTEDGDGWITTKYIFVSAAALCYLASHDPFPDQEEYSDFTAFFEFMRESNGSNERQLIAPEVVRRMIDRSTFARAVTDFGRSSSDNESDITSKVEKAMMANRVVQRIYPREAAITQPTIQLTNLKRDQVAPLMLDLFNHIMQQDDLDVLEGMRFLIRNMLVSTSSEWHEIVFHTAFQIVLKGEDRDRFALACPLIQALNSYGWYQTGMEFSDEITKSFDDWSYPKEQTLGFPFESYFHCEIGNCHRYAGSYQDALEHYETAIRKEGEGISPGDVLVLMRNSAIVLRSMGRTSEAAEIFEKILPLANSDEAIGIETSYVICLILEGRQEEATKRLLSSEKLLRGRSISGVDERSLSLMIAEAYYSKGKLQQALEIYDAHAALDLNKVPVGFTAYPTARSLEIQKKLGKKVSRDQIDNVLLLISESLRRGDFSAGLSEAKAGLIVLGSNLLSSDSRPEEAEAFIDEFGQVGGHSWRVQANKLRLLVSRKHSAAELNDAILNTLQSLDDHVEKTDPDGDPLSLFGHFQTDISIVADIASWARSNNAISPSLTRAAVDFQASPVIARRINSRLGENASLLAATDENTKKLLSDAETAIFQFFAPPGEGKLMAYVSYTVGTGLVSTLLEFSITASRTKRLGSMISFHINRLPTTSSTLCLDRMAQVLGELESFRKTIPSALWEYKNFRIICGPADPTFLSLALGEHNSVSIAPSLSSALRLDERSRGFPRELRLADFSVWRAGDRDDIVAKQISVGEALERTSSSEPNVKAYVHKIGREASASDLAQCLQASDVCRITAHGYLDAQSGYFNLLVSSKGGLPPSAVAMMGDKARKNYSFEFSGSTTLSSSASIVVTSSCEGGSVLTALGWERLGLERSLFLSGTNCLVAPLWEMPSIAGMELTSEIVRRIVQEETKSVQDVVFDVTRDAERDGVSAIACRAMRVFGSSHNLKRRNQ